MIYLRSDFVLGEVILVNFINLTYEKTEMVRNWRNKESIRKWMYSNHIISPEEHSKFIEGLQKDNKNFYWLVEDKKEEYIGVVYLNRIDLENKNTYFGIYSNPDCKMSGAGHLLIECLKKLAFDVATLHTLKLEVIVSNEIAINFYKKSGFNEEGRLKEFVFKDGKWHDVIVMGVLNRD